MRSLFASFIASFALGLLLVPHVARGAESPSVGGTPSQIAALEKSLSGATLSGHFTVTGGPEASGSTDRYELGDVKHLDGENWMFQTHIRYGEHDVTAPLTVAVRWAGDTPMVCVDDLAVPGLGEYTARVFFYRGHYAGYWTGKDHGGSMYGVIEPAKTKDADAKPAVGVK